MKKLLFASTIILFATTVSCGVSEEERERLKEEIKAELTTENSNEENKEIETGENPVSTSITAESDKEDCAKSELMVYLDDPDLTGTNIRTNPGADVITKLVMDDSNPGFMMTISEVENGWFKIEGTISGGGDEIQLPNQTGWIHNSVVSVGTRNYGNQEIILWNEPDGTIETGVINEESYGLRILDLCGEWIKINHKGKVGWVKDEWLCGSPFTTCS